MQLQLQTWTAVERYLQSSRTVIMPIGANSGLASAEHGRRIFERAVSDLSDALRRWSAP